MADFEVDPQELKEYAGVLDGLHQQVDKISQYMHSTACDKSGFTGLFIVLHPVVDLVGNLFDETLKFGHSRLTSLSQGIQQVAQTYSEQDKNAGQLLKDLYDKYESSQGNANSEGGGMSAPPAGAYN